MYQKGENASKSKTRLYNIWKMMRKRCRCENRSDYKYYGGKGIKVCEEWDNTDYGFDCFKAWAMRNGYRDTLTIDRINTNGDYCPENCRWVTMLAQSYNRTTTKNYQNAPQNLKKKYVKYNGKSQTLYAWGKELGIEYHVLINRMKRGWSTKDIFETPVNMEYSRRTSDSKNSPVT
jgi:hypothetical protein